MKDLVVLILWVRKDNTVLGLPVGSSLVGERWKHIDGPQAVGAALGTLRVFTVHDGEGSGGWKLGPASSEAELNWRFIFYS